MRLNAQKRVALTPTLTAGTLNKNKFIRLVDAAIAKATETDKAVPIELNLLPGEDTFMQVSVSEEGDVVTLSLFLEQLVEVMHDKSNMSREAFTYFFENEEDEQVDIDIKNGQDAYIKYQKFISKAIRKIEPMGKRLNSALKWVSGL